MTGGFAQVSPGPEGAAGPASAGLRLGQVVALFLLTLSTAAAFYARTAISPLQEAMRLDLALSDHQMALLQGPAVALPAVLCAIPMGLIVDRFSRARFVLLLTAFALAGGVMVAVGASFATFFAGRVLIGIAQTGVWIAALSLLADLFPPGQIGRAASAMTLGTILGISGAFALGGVFLEAQGDESSGWRTALLWLNAPVAVITILLFWLKEPARRGALVARPPLREAWPGLWRMRKVLLALMGGLLVVDIAVGAVVTWAAPMLSRNYGLSPAEVGGAMAMVMLISGLTGPIVGGLVADYSQRTGGPRRTMLGLAVLAALTVPASFFPVMPFALLGIGTLIAFKAVNQAISVVSSSLTSIVLPNELRGLALSVMQAAVAIISLGVAPLLVSGLSGALGGPARLGDALAIVCVGSALVGAVGFLIGRHAFAKGEGA